MKSSAESARVADGPEQEEPPSRAFMQLVGYAQTAMTHDVRLDESATPQLIYETMLHLAERMVGHNARKIWGDGLEAAQCQHVARHLEILVGIAQARLQILQNMSFDLICNALEMPLPMRTRLARGELTIRHILDEAPTVLLGSVV